MAISALTTAGINTLVSSYTQTETNNKITPLSTRATKYQNLTSAYSNLSSRIDTLKTSLSTLKANGDTTAFTAKTAELSDSSFFSVAVEDSASASSYDLRVDQLAKSDVAVSAVLNSTAKSGSTTGVHKLKIQSGDYTANIDVDLGTKALTNQELMNKVKTAVNADKAIVTSGSVSGKYTGAAGSFVVDLNGTEKTITYASGKSYSDTLDSIVSQLKGTSGLTVEKVKSGSNYSLKFTVTDTSKYISINKSSDTGALLGNLNLDVTKEKGASNLMKATVFSPSSSTSKFTLTATNSGYDNRLQITSDSAFTSMGLTADVLANRYKNTDDGKSVSNSKAGFSLGTQWVNKDLTKGGTVESTDNSNLNAQIEFNGLTVQRNSNTITDLVEGATFSLKGVMKDSVPNVSVEIKSNTATAKSNIQDFITKFNNVYVYLKSATSSVDGVSGPLNGDPSASSLTSILATAAYSQVTGLGDEDINQLSQIGISFSSTAGLSISDSSALDTALSEKPEQVGNLFYSENGVATSLYNSINPYSGSGGYLTTSKNSADANIKSINDKITSTTASINKSADNLRTRYLDLQSQLASLLNTQTNFFGTDNSSALDSMF